MTSFAKDFKNISFTAYFDKLNMYCHSVSKYMGEVEVETNNNNLIINYFKLNFFLGSRMIADPYELLIFEFLKMI